MSPRFPRGGGGGDREARSAAAREQDRRDREARRAAREGREPEELTPLPDDLLPRPSVNEEADPGPAYAEEPAGGHPFDDAYLPGEAAPQEPEPDWHEPAPADREPEPEPDSEPPPAAAEPPPGPGEPPVRHPENFFDTPDDEPFGKDFDSYFPEPDPEPEPYKPAIPPRPALSWEEDEPTRVDQTPAGPARGHRPIPSRPDVELPGTGDSPAVRVLSGGADADPDRPLGTKRVPASALASAAGAEGPPRFGAPPRGTPKSRRGMKRVVPALLILLLLLIAYGAFKVFQPFHGDGTGSVQVVIPTGSGARQIGDELAKRGVVDSGLIFSLRARISGDRDSLRSGPRVLKKDMSYSGALKALTVAPKIAPTVQVAIPEGLTVKQVGSLAHRAELKGSYTTASSSPAARRTARTLGLPTGRSTLEGFFFPATYTLKTTASTADLVAQQLKTFKRETAKVDYSYAKQNQLTRYDVLIIASLIENEAQTAKDRRLIAAVIYNRLKQSIPLQIDATTRYETGNYGNDARPIRQSELDADTPYNTRKRRGLPPTPISSPGLASLQAATNPAKVPFIYYVVKPCGNGAHNFSSTDAEFQKDRDAYDSKREQLGGKDPSNC